MVPGLKVLGPKFPKYETFSNAMYFENLNCALSGPVVPGLKVFGPNGKTYFKKKNGI